MVTSGMSYAVHYELGGRSQDQEFLQSFSRMRIENVREQPVLYVAMATWIPKCNMYPTNNTEPEVIPNEDQEQIINGLNVEVDPVSQQDVPSASDISCAETDEKMSDDENKSSSDCNEDLQELQDEKLAEDPEENDTLGEANTEETHEETEQVDLTQDDEDSDVKIDDPKDASASHTPKKSLTPAKALTPKQQQKKLEAEKKRLEKLKEREEREKKKHEERERIKMEKQKQKQEKDEQRNREKIEKQEQKQKELEQKQKEKELKEEQRRKDKEEKDQKRKDKEEKEEQKRKEKELERLKKQQELEEKNKEKLKLEEQKQKAAAAFVNFFVPKKTDAEEKRNEEKQSCLFKDFEVKSDMRLPPKRRRSLTLEAKALLVDYIINPDESSSYLKDISNKKTLGKCGKTWPYEDPSDEVAIIEDDKDLGETICEEKSKCTKLKAKFLKFTENQRPPYFGTWRKKSQLVKPKRPFGQDKEMFNYEEDSDDDWEEEECGESLDDSDGDDKENEPATDDYEVDNKFFVPHGHLSDDEIDDEATAKLSPESQKQKLKLLKDEFDEDRKSKTNKINPRFIGCIWYDKEGKNVDEPIDRYLKPLAIICNGVITIKKRSESVLQQKKADKRKQNKKTKVA